MTSGVSVSRGIGGRATRMQQRAMERGGVSGEKRGRRSSDSVAGVVRRRSSGAGLEVGDSPASGVRLTALPWLRNNCLQWRRRRRQRDGTYRQLLEVQSRWLLTVGHGTYIVEPMHICTVQVGMHLFHAFYAFALFFLSRAHQPLWRRWWRTQTSN